MTLTDSRECPLRCRCRIGGLANREYDLRNSRRGSWKSNGLVCLFSFVTQTTKWLRTSSFDFLGRYVLWESDNERIGTNQRRLFLPSERIDIDLHMYRYLHLYRRIYLLRTTRRCDCNYFTTVKIGIDACFPNKRTAVSFPSDYFSAKRVPAPVPTFV